jgi:hypothetical protein
MLCPRYKCLAGTLQSSPAKQFGQREGRVSLPLAGQQCKSREYRLSLLELGVGLTTEPPMPANSCAAKPLRLLACEQKTEFEGFG